MEMSEEERGLANPRTEEAEGRAAQDVRDAVSGTCGFTPHPILGVVYTGPEGDLGPYASACIPTSIEIDF